MEIKRSINFFLYFIWISFASGMEPELPTFNSTSFNQNAALYGNKAANLIELKKNFLVPHFFLISDTQVKQFLNSIQITTNGNETVLQFINHQMEIFSEVQPRDKTILTVAAKVILLKIEKIIEQTFNQNPIIVTELNDFLQQVSGEDDLLMVRSTGAEDSKELANAGGNKSIAAVKPNVKSVSQAIGQVIASYFSEKSISQRLLGQDNRIFGQLFMPVFLQVMITKDPISGVIFSQEIEGNTPGVTQIQATYGHGEGVVNGLVAVDTFYIGPSNIIHSLIGKKNYRMAPSADLSQLERVANKGLIIDNPCLNAKTILTLKKIAVQAQDYYGYPLDIEFVIQANKIYLVQARPIVTKASIPSYLKNELLKQILPADKHSLFTIISGGGSVRIIDDENAIIIDENIRKALFEKFLKIENRDLVKAVIIQEIAPALSHEANILNGAGKFVAYDNQVQVINEWITDKKFPILIDAQRGIAVSFSKNKTFDMPEDAIIPNAWLTHPIAKKTSLFPQFLNKLSKEDSDALQPKEFFKEKSLSVLIELLQEGNADEAVKALRSILARVWGTISTQQSKEKNLINKKLILQLKNIFMHMLLYAHEILEALKKWEESPQKSNDRLLRLYPVVFFEALIRQTASINFVNDYSLGALIKIEQEEEKISKELEIKSPILKEYMIQYAKAGEFALTNQLQSKWNLYIKELSTIKDFNIQQNFAHLMLNLSKLDMVPFWLNTSFNQKIKTDKDVFSLTQELIEEYYKVEDFFNILQEKKNFLQAVQASVALWEEPDKFEKLWSNFKNNIADYLISENYKKDFNNSTTLGKNGAVTIMNYAVSIFDTIIKTLEASKMYSDPIQKVTRFRAMLYAYFDLLSNWSNLHEIKNDLNKLLDDITFKTIDDYFAEIKKIIENAPNSKWQLQGSPGFNVAGASLGSKANWQRSIGSNTFSSGSMVGSSYTPKNYNLDYVPTLEDMFTLIHQNLLILLSILSKKEEKLDVPQIIKELTYEAKKITLQSDKIQTPSLIGISFNGATLIYYYNLPLRNHSNTFQIIYDLREKKATLAVQFIGFSGPRWQKLASAIHLMSLNSNLFLKQSPMIDNARGIISFAWNIDTVDQARIALSYFRLLAQSTIDNQPLLLGMAKIINPHNYDLEIRSLIKMIVNLMTKIPSMAMFIGELMTLSQYDLNSPFVKKFYQNLKLIFPELPHEIQENIIMEYEIKLSSAPEDKSYLYIYLIDLLKVSFLNKEIIRDVFGYLRSAIRFPGAQGGPVFTFEALDALYKLALELQNSDDKEIQEEAKRTLSVIQGSY